jgi:ribosomal protein L37AE/L43A
MTKQVKQKDLANVPETPSRATEIQDSDEKSPNPDIDHKSGESDIDPDIVPESDESDTSGNESSEVPDEMTKYPIQSCRQCGSESVKRLDLPHVVDYRNVEWIIRQNVKCEKCGAFYVSRVIIPKPAKGLCSMN